MPGFQIYIINFNFVSYSKKWLVISNLVEYIEIHSLIEI